MYILIMQTSTSELICTQTATMEKAEAFARKTSTMYNKPVACYEVPQALNHIPFDDTWVNCSPLFLVNKGVNVLKPIKTWGV